jgi:hypothetical protein
MNSEQNTYDLESNHYHILIETHSEDENIILSNPSPRELFLEENTCFTNNKYYGTYIGIVIILVIAFIIVYVIWI